MSDGITLKSLESIYNKLSRVRQQVLDAEIEYSADLQAVPSEWRGSAQNLVHYLGLRQHDIRPIQIELGFLGLSSLGRLEVTDAAMSGRAECVMLNKGPFILQTVQFLDQVLNRMRDHHHKKTPMLRKLKVSEGRFRSEQKGSPDLMIYDKK